MGAVITINLTLKEVGMILDAIEDVGYDDADRTYAALHAKIVDTLEELNKWNQPFLS